MDKANKDVLGSVIEHHFYKMGKKMTNLSKTTKPRLLEIIKKQSIDFDIVYKEVLEEKKQRILRKEQEEKKLDEERQIFEKEEAKLYKKYNDPFYKKHIDKHIDEVQKLYDEKSLMYHKLEMIMFQKKYDRAGVKYEIKDDDTFIINGTHLIVGKSHSYIEWTQYKKWINRTVFKTKNSMLIPDFSVVYVDDKFI
jgi:hypothetical protein